VIRRIPSIYQRHCQWHIENSFDELKNQWGWGGFTTRDLKRCRLMAGAVALVFNWWNLFVRLADPDRHREAITSRPLLLQAVGDRPAMLAALQSPSPRATASMPAPAQPSPASPVFSRNCVRLRSS